MKLLPTLYLIFFLFPGCASLDMYPNYINWDLNSDDQLDQYEFVSGYIESKYFQRWGHGSTLSVDSFLTGVFNSIDTDDNKRLAQEEFDKIRGFYFWQFPENFDQWDNNKDEFLNPEEFVKDAKRTKLPELWDSSGDNLISKREIAIGMFRVSDVDNDKRVNSLEFNLWKINR